MPAAAPAATPDTEILEAIETFICEIPGFNQVVVHAGTTRIDANHPLVKAYPQHFRPIQVDPQFALSEPEVRGARPKAVNRPITTKE